MKKNYINHIAFVIDRSGSIAFSGLTQSIIDVFDAQIERLKSRSKELDQETRVSLYLFADKVECVYFDKDIKNVQSLRGNYSPNGNTAMIDATLTCIRDLKEINIRYDDHSFLIYVLTDGENNIHNDFAYSLTSTIAGLSSLFTVAALVPNSNGVYECKRFGFPAQNIQIWETTQQGAHEMGEALYAATDSYMVGRSKGIVSTRSLFSLDASNISKTEVKKSLDELSPTQYHLLNVGKESYIKDFIESWKLPFVKGANYYQITKPETVQAYKQIIVQDKVTGKLYAGINARKLLSLPDYEVKVQPSSYGKYNIFVQSHSSNRKLVRGTQLVVLN